jgi:hypothetical protein
MTYQEANALVDDFSFVYKGKSISKEALIECREVIHKALEKKIPKKPTTETINRGISVSGEYDIDFNYLCPNCNTIVGDYETDEVFYKFCPDCGQAIDWSEQNG